jgi:hypothetical protein
MPLVARVVDATNVDAITQAIRDIVDMRPIGPVAASMNADQLVLVFDSAVGTQLTTGTNSGITTTATPLTTTPSTGREVVVQADPANGANVLVGGQAAQNIVLVAGAALALDWTDVSTIWAKSATGSMTVNWMVRG